MLTTEHHPQFFTATILEWKPLLAEDKYQNIILDSLRFLVSEQRVKVNSFVIMSNHIHIIWHAINGFTPQQVQHSFLKFTAQQIKFDLQKGNPQLLQQFRVNAADREFQFWERNPLAIDLYSHEVYMQKLEYIHYNPVEAGLCFLPEDYYYSSARFYEKLQDDFGFLTHWQE
ncbi:MAG: transposase [Chitinophagaceae bacterium]|nr:transposase [Chitinophagaceae bacterium]